MSGYVLVLFLLMLIGSHFLEDSCAEFQDASTWFTPLKHHLVGVSIGQQLALLFSHDEIWETCSTPL